MTGPPITEATGEDGRVERSPSRHRPLLTAAVAFSVGIAAARGLALSFLPAALPGLGAVACLALLRKRLGEGVQTLLVVMLVASAGAATYAAHVGAADARSRTSLAGRLAPHPTLCFLTGTVRSEVRIGRVSPLLGTTTARTYERSLLRVSVDAVERNGRVVPASGDVNVEVRGELAGVGYGDRVRAFGWIVPLRGNRASDRYARSREFVARMSVSDPEAVQVVRRSPGSLFRFLYALKGSFRRQIDAHFSGKPAMVLKTILLGDRERLGRGLRETFEKSGTMHILSISGLHVAIVYLAAAWLCRMLLLQRWRRRLVVLGLVLAYAALTGGRPATVRATLMIFLLEMGTALKFTRDPVNAVACAGLLILAVAPHHLFEAGFQLTFAAVFGILMFADPITRWLRGRPTEFERLVEVPLRSWKERWARRARWKSSGALGVCAAATLSVLPLQAYYFQIVTPVSVFATAAVFPVVVLLIGLGFVFLGVASVVPPLAPALAWGLSGVTGLFAGLVGLASRVPLGHVYVAPPSAAWVWLFYAALLAVAARRWLRLPGRWPMVLPVALLCAYVGWRISVRPDREMAATFVNVGHGTCCVITRAGQTIVYDCGSGTPLSTRDVGRGPAALEMWRQGIKRIDLLLLSHTDADHVNGVLSLIDRFPPRRVVGNPGFTRDEIGAGLKRAFAERGIPFEEAAAGDRIELPGLTVEVLWPPARPGPWRLNKINDRSLVVRVRADGRSVLLTADIERYGMGGLLATWEDLHADVLYVPHHGADEPVLAEFVRAVRPQHAVISSERRDPAEQARVRALFRGAWLYHTWLDGTIRLKATRGAWRRERQ